jgi:peptidoglycan hydrolase FlgJ
MAIKPSSDIVLEVLKAADPVRAQAVAQKLSALGGDVGAADDFARALDDAGAKPAAPIGVLENASNMRDRLASLNVDAARDQKAARTELDFEASMLKTFVDAILPKDESAVYGQGTAGDIWKSMLADQIARQIAKSGAFGISKRLFATHPLPGHAASAAASLAAVHSWAIRGAGETLDPIVGDSEFGQGGFLASAGRRS